MDQFPKTYSLASFKKQVVREKRKAYSFKEDHKVAPFKYLRPGISFMDVVLYAAYSKDMVNTYLDIVNPLPSVLERDRERVLYICETFNHNPYILSIYMEETITERIKYYEDRRICSDMVNTLQEIHRKVQVHRLHRGASFDVSRLNKFKNNLKSL